MKLPRTTVQATIPTIELPHLGRYIVQPDGDGFRVQNLGIDTGSGRFDFSACRNWERPGDAVSYTPVGDGTAYALTEVTGTVVASVDDLGAVTLWRVGDLYPLDTTDIKIARRERVMDITLRMAAAGFSEADIATIRAGL